MAKSLKEQLAQIALKKMKLSNGETIPEAMAREARRLYDCIQYYIDKWYRDYEPVVYERTYRYQGALFAEDIADVRVVGDTLRIGLKWHDDLAWHESLPYLEFTDEYDRHWVKWLDMHDSYTPFLMEFGWTSRKLEYNYKRRIENFTHFDGIHAIEQGINDFNKKNTLGIKIDSSKFDSMKDILRD